MNFSEGSYLDAKSHPQKSESEIFQGVSRLGRFPAGKYFPAEKSLSQYESISHLEVFPRWIWSVSKQGSISKLG
jgi:hypothetical protein